jgi:hypothetical protein
LSAYDSRAGYQTGSNAGHEFTSSDPVCHRALPF